MFTSTKKFNLILSFYKSETIFRYNAFRVYKNSVEFIEISSENAFVKNVFFKSVFVYKAHTIV